MISTGREGARTDEPLILGFQKLKPSMIITANKTARYGLYGP